VQGKGREEKESSGAHGVVTVIDVHPHRRLVISKVKM
jgi:hypothetical protein